MKVTSERWTRWLPQPDLSRVRVAVRVRVRVRLRFRVTLDALAATARPVTG